MGTRTTQIKPIEVTVQCVICGTPHIIQIANVEGYNGWLHNAGNIQDLLPELSANDRELLISGIYKDCFDRMFAGYEEDEAEEDAGEQEEPADEQREPSAYGYPCDLDHVCPYGDDIKYCCDRSMFAGRNVPCRSEGMQ